MLNGYRKVPQRKWRAHGSGAASQWEHAGCASRRRVGLGDGASPKAEGPSGTTEALPPCSHSLFEARFESPTRAPSGTWRGPTGNPTGSLQAPSGTSHSRLQRPAGRPRRQSWGAQPRATRPTAGRLLSDRGVRHARRREGASGPARPLTHGTRRSPTRLSWQGCRPTKHRRKCERGNA